MATMDIDQRSEASHELGLRYTRLQHRGVLVAKDEEVRRQKVQVALLTDENDRLQAHAASLEDRIQTLSQQYADAQADAADLQQKVETQEKQLRAHAREHDQLRSQVASIESATTDTTKILTEKLALSRELAMLKPEMDHLRSQLAHQKDVLAEKLALERQLNTVEVELANEKRRASDGESSSNSALKQQLQDLETKLATEKRLRQAAAAELETAEKALEDEKREAQRAKKLLETEAAEARGQIDVFEQRVGDLKSKLREVREELKNAQAELASGANTQEKRGVAVPTKEGGPVKKKAVAGAKKRRAEEPSGPELMLQTPGLANEGRAKRPLKKRGFDPAAAVQKSTFSITPFLNKTTNPMDESDAAAPAPAAEPSAVETAAPGDESELPEDSIMGRRISASGATLASVDMSESSTPSVAAKAGDAPKRRGRPVKEKADAPAKKSKLAEVSQVSDVEAEAETADVSAPEAPEQENIVPVAPKVAPKVALKEKKAAPKPKAVAEVEPKKKKRKILGAGSKTVFDEDDDNGENEDMVAARPVKPAAAAAGGVKRAVKPLGGAVNKRTMLGGMRNAFGGAAGGGFSPLKRERRGVNASFLA